MQKIAQLYKDNWVSDINIMHQCLSTNKISCRNNLTSKMFFNKEY